MSKLAKQPKHKGTPTPKKQPGRSFDPDAWYEMPIRWSFVKIDKNHESWGLFCNTEQTEQIIDHLASLEQLGSWHKVLSITSGRNGNTRNHEIQRCDLTKEAQKRLDELNHREDTFCSVATGARTRIWGVRSDNVLEIIWLDPNHEVCPSFRR